MGLLARLTGWLKRDTTGERLWGRWFDSSWLSGNGFQGPQASSGVYVSEATALRNTAVLAAVRLISETVSTLPFHIYKRLDRGRAIATDHPVYSLIHDSPNEEMTALTFRETLTGHLLTWGNAYAQIVRNAFGRPVSLWPLLPEYVSPRRDNQKILYYQVRTPNGQSVPLEASEVLHIHGLGHDGVMGYSPIRLCREAIGLGLATERHGATWFGNGSKPSGILSMPGELPTIEERNEYRREWEKMHGKANSNRLAILGGGMTFTPVTVPNNDAQFLETRTFQVVEVARIYRVPPHMLYEMGRATWGNAESMGQDFLTYSLTPWLERWEQEVNRKLLLPAERATFYAEHDPKGLLRGDTMTRYGAYSIGRTGGWLSANDIREAENLPPIEGGDVYLKPLNMADQAAPKAPTQREIPLNMARRDCVQAAENPKDFLTFLDRYFTPNGPLAAALRWWSDTDEADIPTLLEKYRISLLNASGEATARELPDAVRRTVEAWK